MGFPSSDNWFLRPGTSKPGGGGRRSRGDAGGQRPSFGENRRSTGVGGQNEEEPREVEQLDSSFSLEDNSSGGSIENVGSGSVEANRGSEEAELDSLGARIRGEVQRRQEELHQELLQDCPSGPRARCEAPRGAPSPDIRGLCGVAYKTFASYATRHTLRRTRRPRRISYDRRAPLQLGTANTLNTCVPNIGGKEAEV